MTIRYAEGGIRMNRKHLDIVIRNYIAKFAEINYNPANDEGYKLVAIDCFQKHWDINAKDFQQMFSDAVAETYNLIDNTVQPLGGIKKLLTFEEEVDFVKSCFAKLFVEDGEDLAERLKRIDTFVDDVNGRIAKYYPKSWRYQQNRASVILYLNLWAPYDNYIYKATEVKEMMNCIEYSDDFGGGQSFSLAKYYKMCDAILAELPRYPELLRLHDELRNKKNIKVKDDLHVLVYDLIYCADYYKLYDDIPVTKTAAKKSKAMGKTVEDAEEREALLEQLVTVEQLLTEVLAEKLEYPDVVGLHVVHKKFGEGVVTSATAEMVTIDFAGTIKKFQTLTGFVSKYFTCDDSAVFTQINRIEEHEQKKTALETEVKTLKMKLARF